MAVFDYTGLEIDHFFDYEGTEIPVGGGLPSPNVVDTEADTTLLWTANHNTSVQGSCIDDSGNLYAIYYRRGSIAKYNVLTKTGGVTTGAFESEAYGHANGMCFNPNTGYLYIAASLTGECYVLDPSDYSLVDTLYALDENDEPYYFWNICYDRKTRQFITFANGNIIRRYNDNFELVLSGTYESGWQSTYQDIETDGDYIYCCSTHVNVTGQTGVADAVYVFTMDGKFVTSFVLDNQTEELEDICYDWNTGLWYATYYNSSTGVKFFFLNMKAYYTPDEVISAAAVL